MSWNNRKKTPYERFTSCESFAVVENILMLFKKIKEKFYLRNLKSFKEEDVDFNLWKWMAIRKHIYALVR